MVLRIFFISGQKFGKTEVNTNLILAQTESRFTDFHDT